MLTRDRSGSGGRVAGEDGRVVLVVVAVVAIVDGGGLVGAVEVVLDCCAEELHAARRAIANAAHVRRIGRG
jgi:hypothetical protein